jgi:Mechanosensitive ion channel
VHEITGLSKVRSSRLSLRKACYLLFPALITLALSAEVSPAASDLPSNQQVIALLTESIDWYRHCTIERQIATDPLDLVFLEDNRSVAAQIVQLSFDFARADAAVTGTSSASKQKNSSAIATGSSSDVAQLVRLENDAELWEQQATQEIEAIEKKLRTAHGVERRNLQAALDATQSRLAVSQAGLTTLRQLAEFMQTFSGHERGDLESSIDDLARTVPNVTSPTAVAQQLENSTPFSLARTPDSGILALSSEASVLGRKLRILDDEILRTEKLRQSSEALRNPLLSSINKRVPAVAETSLQVTDLSELQQQKARLDELAAFVKALSPAVLALDKQKVLLTAYASHLKSWRAAVITEDKKAWKNLVSRLLGAALVIGAVLIIGAVVRRVTRRHMGDTERRHIILVIQRVVFWSAIIIVAAFAFASDLTSLATFFGLLAAGLAVALQSFIVSAAGYFVLVGRRGIRIGDRVQISGVTGDVTDIGWLQFQVKEIDTRTQQPTGAVVTFSNSIVLASPGTGLSKFKREGSKSAQLEVAAQA